MSKTILTVDDSATVRQMVTFTLQAAGYDVLKPMTDRTRSGNSLSRWRWSSRI